MTLSRDLGRTSTLVSRYLVLRSCGRGAERLRRSVLNLSDDSGIAWELAWPHGNF